MTTLRVKDLMTQPVATVEEDASLETATRMMQVGGVRHLPVVRGAQLVGVLSHRDALLAHESPRTVVDPEYRHDSARAIRVGDIMSTHPETAAPEDSLLEAATRILEHHHGCLPVVAGGEVVGILTEADFVRHTIRELSDTST